MVKSSQQNPIALVTQGSPLLLTTVKLGSPTVSSGPSKSKPSKSKPKSKTRTRNKELIQIAKLLLAQAKSQDEDDASDGSASFEASTSHDSYDPQNPRCSGPICLKQSLDSIYTSASVTTLTLRKTVDIYIDSPSVNCVVMGYIY
ncbi:hypothetical protein ACSBR2_030237 [Camellia fascicularis]